MRDAECSDMLFKMRRALDEPDELCPRLQVQAELLSLIKSTDASSDVLAAVASLHRIGSAMSNRMACSSSAGSSTSGMARRSPGTTGTSSPVASSPSLECPCGHLLKRTPLLTAPALPGKATPTFALSTTGSAATSLTRSFARCYSRNGRPVGVPPQRT